MHRYSALALLVSQHAEKVGVCARPYAFLAEAPSVSSCCTVRRPMASVPAASSVPQTQFELRLSSSDVCNRDSDDRPCLHDISGSSRFTRGPTRPRLGFASFLHSPLLSSPLLSSLANCVVAGGSDHANGHTELLTLGLPGELFLLFKTPLPFPETDTAARWNRSPSPAVMFVPIFASSRLEPCCNVQDTKRISERDAHGGIATEGSLELKSRWP